MSGEWKLNLAFDTNNVEFARGVEVGMVYERMQTHRYCGATTVTIHNENTEMMLRIAENLGLTFKGEELDSHFTAVTFSFSPALRAEGLE